MRGLSAADVVDVWERGAGHAGVTRSLDILAVACPELDAPTLAGLTAGQLDAMLLEVRRLTLGPDLEVLSRCPACGELLEFTARAGDLRLPEAAEAAPVGTALTWSDGQARLVYRLPVVGDLVAIAAVLTPEAALAALLERCVLRAEVDAAAVPVGALPAEIVEALAAEMARHDPQADLQLTVTCPDCGHGWQAPFDIASFFWAEIAAAAQRLIREVHWLARAYGWREGDILALSAFRRQLYLEMIQG